VLTIDANGRVTAATTIAPVISNVAGGAANRILYQTSADNTGFISAPTLANTVLQWNGTGFIWSPAAAGNVASVTASLPISSSGGTTPNISISQATATTNGYLSSSDWSTFNNKQEGLTLTTVGTSGPATLVGGILNVPNYNPGSAVVTAVTATSPIVSTGGSTPNISLPAADGLTDGYLASTDWTTFNNKVTSVSGTSGRITSTGGTTPALDLTSGIVSAGTTGSSSVIPVVTVDTYGRVTSITTAANPQGTVTSINGTGSVNGITLTGTVTSTGNLTLGGTLSNVSLATQVTGNLPVTNLNNGLSASATTFWRGDGTWATPIDTGITSISIASSNGLAGTSSGGTTPILTLSTTVTGLLKGNGTSISAATSGTDYAPATSGTSILYGNGTGGFSNVTIGSGVSFVGGTLSATGSGGTVTSVTGTSPIVSSGGTTPAISIPAATSTVSGYLTSTDWTTFNNKGSGSVTSVAALTLGTTGTDLSSTVANGTTTPVITLNVPTASATNRGALSSTDWTIFNNKVTSVSGTAGRITSTGGNTPVIDLASGVATAGTTGSSTLIPVVTIDTYGRVTSITTASNPQGTVTSVATSGSVNGITLTGGTITSSGTITLGGTLSGVSLTTQVTGTLPVGNGGTGAITLTGYVQGSGTSAFTASSTIPNTDITGLGTMSTQNASSVAITGGSINGTTIGAGTAAAGTFTNITLTTGTISTTPTSGTDIVNKSYADSISSGVNYHPSVQYASAATLTSTSGAYTYSNGTGGVGATITGPVNTALIIDGHTMVAGDVTAGTRVLIKDETGAYVNTTTPSAAFNGAYVVTQVATVSVGWVLTRATDYDTSGSGTNEIDQGDFFYVVYGTANTNTSWIQQTALPITVGTTQLSFVQFGAATFYTAGTGLTLSGSNQFSITNTGVTANTYGSASNVPVLTVNAQGQLTSVTNTPIAINVSAVTGAVTGVTATAPVVSSGGTAPVISMAAASGSTNGYLTSTDWTTFNNKGTGTVTAVSIVSANGFAGTSSGGATPALTLTTSVTGLLKGNGTAISAATSGTDYAPATSGSSILYGNSSGGFSNVTIGSGVSFVGGTLSATGSGGTVTSVTATSPVASTGGTTPVISMPAATSTVSGYLTSTDWNTFNSKGTVTSVTGTSPIVSSGGNTPAISIPAATSLAGGYLTSTDWSTFNSKVTSVTATSPVASTGGTTPVISMPAASSAVSGYLTSTDWNTFNSKGSGTVTSVTATSPVASSGGTTPAISLSSGYGDTQNPYASKSANYFLAAPNGVAGVPTFRSIVAADIPTLNQNTTGTASNVTGTVAIANGGTGATTAAAALTSLGAYPASNPNGYTSNTGTVTSVAALTLGTAGSDLSSTVANGTTTPVITLNVPTASATNRGALSAADWTTFNNKGSGNISGSGTTNYVPKFTSSTAIGNSLIQDNGVANVGINLAPDYGAALQVGQGGGYYGIAVYDSTGLASTNGFTALTHYSSGAFLSTYFDTSIGADTLRFGTDGTERMRIDHYGNVGIGTSSPTAKLTITDATSSILIDGGSISTPRSDGLYIQASAAAPIKLYTNGSERLRIDSSGNVGIGTSNPSYKLHISGTGYASSDFRAPIFYDSDNTAYYANPASTSNFYALNVSQSIGGYVNGASFANDSEAQADIRNRVTSGFYEYSAATTALGWPVNSGSWQHLLACTHSNDSNYYSMQFAATFFDQGLFYRSTAGSGTTGWSRVALYGNNYGSSLYATIYYDSDNTGYYVDPASTSNVNAMLSYSYQGNGNVGGTGSASWHPSGIYSAGTNWLYGTKYFGNGGLYDGADARFTIIYDTNDTAYYLDPASTGISLSSNGIVSSGVGTNGGFQNRVFTSGRNRIWSFGNADAYGISYFQGGPDYIGLHFGTATQAASQFWVSDSGISQTSGSSRAPVFYDSDNTGYYLNPNGGSNLDSVVTNEVYTNGWFRNNSANCGLYSQVHLNHWYASTSGYWNLAGTNNNYCGIVFRTDGHQTTPRGFVYADNGNNIGFLNQDASWRLRVTGGDYTEVNGSSIRAPIYYDIDNTGYYIDPNNSSNINTIYADNWFRSSGSTGWYNSSYSGGIYMQDTTWVRVYNSKAFYVDNQIAATGNITAYYSDERLKTKTSKIENPLEKISKLEGFHYVENELAKSLGYTNDRQQVGLSAQQVQSVLPEAVSLAPVDMHTDKFSGKITSKSGENYLTVDYSRLVPLLVEAIKAQQAQIDELKQLVGKLSS
jgi:hypothetical protein